MSGSTLSRRRFLEGAALAVAPLSLAAQAPGGAQQDALRAWYEKRALALAGTPAAESAKLRDLLAEWASFCPPWTGRLDEYDAGRFGPLLAVSDEGENAAAIARAAHGSAKARALRRRDPMAQGLMIDGERMVSAGEGPIGPDEYAKLIAAAFGQTLCSTNVGVRVNARLYPLFPEFSVAEAAAGRQKGLAAIFAAFRPFLKTPDGVPRPLTVRLIVRPGDSPDTVRTLVAAIEAGRAQGLVGPAALHRVSLLSIAGGPIRAGNETVEIERVIALAAQAGVAEVAIDGDLTPGARQRLSVASLLNILDVPTLRDLFAAARRNGVRLVYRYQVDANSAARTIWTGLQAARSYGFTAGKYGLVPLTLEEQEQVVTLISGWTRGWSTVPAFYVDTPLVTADDVYEETRCQQAALLWLEKMSAAGARLALFDCPDRLAARHLVRDSEHPEGVFTLDQIAAINRRAGQLGIRPMWSGGLNARLAHALGEQQVFAIFCTGAASRRVPVHGSFAGDPEMASEGAPTEAGVRRVHALLLAGFLASALRARQPGLAGEIEARAEQLLQPNGAESGAEAALARLDEALVRGWTAHWAAR